MIKPYKPPLFLIMLLLLLLPKIALAENMKVTYNDISLVNSQCFTNLLTFSTNTYTQFVIIYDESNSLYKVYVPRSSINITAQRSNANLYLKINTGTDRYYSINDCSTVDFEGYNGSVTLYTYNDWYTSGVYILYSSVDITITGSYPIDITNGIDSYTCDINSTCSYLPMYYWVNSTPPVPPDDTPLLTSFVSTTLDSLTVICDFIISSYIYLSIFVVFILTFVILLLRRLR